MSAATAAHLASIGRWLAKADPDPDHAHRWWGAQQVALLPLGRIWDAVKTEAGHGERALSAGACGPVVADPAGWLFFLVPPGTAETWVPVPGTECLGRTAYLTIPAPQRRSAPGVYWRVLPDGRGTLVDPQHLRAALSPREGARA